MGKAIPAVAKSVKTGRGQRLKAAAKMSVTPQVSGGLIGQSSERAYNRGKAVD